jgi:hypothetical protein
MQGDSGCYLDQRFSSGRRPSYLVVRDPVREYLKLLTSFLQIGGGQNLPRRYLQNVDDFVRAKVDCLPLLEKLSEIANGFPDAHDQVIVSRAGAYAT